MPSPKRLFKRTPNSAPPPTVSRVGRAGLSPPIGPVIVNRFASHSRPRHGSRLIRLGSAAAGGGGKGSTCRPPQSKPGGDGLAGAAGAASPVAAAGGVAIGLAGAGALGG